MSTAYIVIEDHDLQDIGQVPSLPLYAVKARRTIRWRGKRFNLRDSRLRLTHLTRGPTPPHQSGIVR